MARSRDSRPVPSERTLRHGDFDRRYLLRNPRPEATGLPLVVELHGRGIDALMFDLWTGYRALADEEGFVLAMPYASRGVWNDGRFGGAGTSGRNGVDDVGFLLALIDELVDSAAVDPKRVYLVGMSNGAVMAGRIAWQRSDRIAAIAQVAGTAAASLEALPASQGPVPIIHIHGTHDRASPYEGGQASFMLRLFMRGHASPAMAVDEWARTWVERNQTNLQPVTELLGSDVTLRTWHGATPASDLAFYRVDGAGHTWPGVRVWSPPHLGHVSRTIDATRLTWQFLCAHSL